MADRRPLITDATGVTNQVPDADSLIVGSGIKTTVGNLTITAASDSILLASGLILTDGNIDRITAGALSIGPSTATEIDIGDVGVLTLILGDLQVDGTQTMGGELEIGTDLHFTEEVNHTILVDPSVAAATPGGTLTIQSGDGNGASGGDLIIIPGSGTSGGTLELAHPSGTNLSIDATGIRVTSGVLYSGTSGNINLPNNGSVRFKIEGNSVSSAVTAANLDTLTNGARADSLHDHALVKISGLSGEVLAAGELVSIDGVAGRVFKADANGAGQLPNVIGVADSSVGVLEAVEVVVLGERAIPDAEWDSVPALADVGKYAYLSETAGNWTLTAPSTSGSTVIRVGIVSVGGAGTVKVVFLPREPVVLA